MMWGNANPSDTCRSAGVVMRRSRWSLLGLAVAVGGCAIASQTPEERQAVAFITVAAQMVDKCDGVEAFSGPGVNMLEAAAELAAQDLGLRENALKTLLFYAEAPVLAHDADVILRPTGASLGDTDRLCALADEIAGTDDPIGRYLVKGGA